MQDCMMNEEQSYYIILHYISYNNNNNYYYYYNTEEPAPSHVLNKLALNCHTKLVTSLYFKEEKSENFTTALCIVNYRVYNELH
jgi:uncharacterized protein YpiB (UPF0302 family)